MAASAFAALPATPLHCVIPFVQEVIESGAQVCTDGSAAYRSLAELGFTRQRTVMLGSDAPAPVSMAGVHRVAALVQRWILGTYHGSVQSEHLEAYLDEFVFRFNRRTSNSRGMLCYRLLQQAVGTPPLTYRDVEKMTGMSGVGHSICALDVYPCFWHFWSEVDAPCFSTVFGRA